MENFKSTHNLWVLTIISGYQNFILIFSIFALLAKFCVHVLKLNWLSAQHFLTFKANASAHCAYIYIKYDQDFKMTIFTSIFNTKIKFWANGVALLVALITQKNSHSNPKT